MNKIMKIVNLKYILAFLGLAFFTACGDSDPADGGDATNQREFSIADFLTAGSNTKGGDYNVLYDAFEKAGLLTALESGSFTLLAPSDDAFGALGITDVDDVSVEDLTTLLNYHLVGSTLDAESLTGRITTNGGGLISVSDDVVNGVATASLHFSATNGNVFQLDGVLTPTVGNLSDVLADNSDLSLAAAAFDKAGVALTGSTFLTIFAPDNDAMTDAGYDQAFIDAATAEDLAAVMNYHVIVGDLFSAALSGEFVTELGPLTEVPGLTVSDEEAGGADIVSLDNAADNGVIHIIDDVISPPVTMGDAVGPNADLNFGYDFLIYDGIYAGMQRVGLDVTYLSDPSQVYTVVGPCCGSFVESDYPDDADLIEAIEAHIFEGFMDYINIGTAGGTRITSVGGDEYVVTSSGFINGSIGNAFGGGGYSATVYNGVVSNVLGLLNGAGLPEESITDQLDADGNFGLFSAALKALDATTTGDYTVLAVDDATFTAVYGYTTVAEVESADADEFSDLLNHVIPGFYWAVDVDVSPLPTLTAASGAEIVFSSDGDNIGVIVEEKDLTNFPILIGVDYYNASNGVIHQMDDVIAF